MNSISPERYFLRLSLAVLVFGTVAAPSFAEAHKVRVTDPVLSQELAKKGSRLLGDYGSYQLYEVDQVNVGINSGHRAEIRDDYNRIRLNAAELDTTKPEVKALRRTVGSFSGKRMHLIQFIGPVRPEWREELEKSGVQIVDYVPENTYLVYGDASALSQLQNTTRSAPHVQWDGEYLSDYRIHPRARPFDANGNPRALETDVFAIQLVVDPETNPATLALIDRLKLAPIQRQYNLLHYINVFVRLQPENLAAIANQPDVISIQPFITPQKFDERQDQIVAGNLTGTEPTGPGYLAWLASKGFTQAQFTSSGFAVDLSDSGIDNGTIAPGHFGLYTLGDTNSASRVIYNRLLGTPNSGSTIQGCDGHGTINSHIISAYNDLSNGFPHADSTGFLYDLGVCPFVQVGSSVIFDPGTFTYPNYPNLQSQAYHSGARISNNSWGAPTAGAYNSDSQAYDALVRDAQPSGSTYPVTGNQEMVIVFAAGNAGSGSQTVGSPGTAKNVITVGASENVRSMSSANGGNNPSGNDGCSVPDTSADSADDIASFSSRGPCSDGRIKPDIVAPGTHITGGAPQSSPPPSPSGTGNDLACFAATGVCALLGGGTTGNPSNFFPVAQQFYTESSGTSHSTPCVVGACALLRQYFINASLTPPSPAMTKAFLINSARYLTGTSANDTLWSNNQGMGELNLGTAFDSAPRVLCDEVPADLFTASGQTRRFLGTVSDPSKPFRVTLAWTDAPGSTTGNAYKNDLDLTVTVGGNTYLGNVFSGQQSVTGGSVDHKNNVESVFLPAGTTGNFTVTVTADNINSDGVPGNSSSLDQDFALIVYNGVETPQPAIVASNSTLMTEGCTPTNGVIDPGETVTVSFSLANEGTGDTTNLVATLLATGGVTAPSGPQAYGALVAGGAAVAEAFTFTANGTCGGTITGTLQLQDGAVDLGTVTFVFPLGATATNLAQSFDGVTVPNLPSGWTTSAGGSLSAWVTATWQSDTAPNAAFTAGASGVGSNALVSPMFAVATSSGQLSFRHSYDFQTGSSLGRDGGVLEIKIGSGLFADIITAGGSFVSGGYNNTLSTTRQNPLGGRSAWSGNSGGFITTLVNLPAAAAGQNVQLRWRSGSDINTSSVGWYVDTISVSEPACCVTPSANLTLAKSASPNPAIVGASLAYTLSVTNNGPSTATSVTVTDSLPASVTFNSASASQGTCTNIAGIVTCSLGNLASNAAATITISVVPNAAGSVVNTAVTTAATSDPNTLNNTATVTTIVDTPPQLSVAPSSRDYGLLLTGQTSNQTFSVINAGQATLNGTATLVTAVSPFAIAGGSPFTVAGGQTGTVTVSFSPGLTGSFSNTVAFSSNGGASSNAVTGTAVTPAHLSVNPTSQDFGTIATGATAQASFVVTNTGGATLSGTATITATAFGVASGGSYSVTGFGSTNVIVSFTPPSVNSFTGNVIFVSTGGNSTNVATGSGAIVPVADFSANITTGAPPLAVTFADSSSGTITNRFWDFGDSTTASTTATNVPHTYTSAGTNTVTLIASGPLGASTNTRPHYILVTNIVPQADLALIKTGLPNPVFTSRNLTYTLTIANLGPSTATSVTVTDALPASVTVVSAIATVGTCTNAGGLVTCFLGSLTTNATAIVTIVGTTSAISNIASITNTASVSANEWDPLLANNTATAVTTVYLDSIGDGIPDWWRQQHFGSGNTTNGSSCASCDADGDGFSNLQEYLAGTSPTDATDALRITDITPSGADFIISFTTTSGKIYELDWTDDVVAGTWTPVAANIAGTGSIVPITDPGAAALPQRFYRVLLLP